MLLFGIAVYYSVSFTVIHQLDDTLRTRAETVYLNTHIGNNGDLSVNLALLDLPEDVICSGVGPR